MYRFALSLTATLLSSTAFAAVTPEEVYEINRDVLARLGLTVVADTNRTGDTLSVAGGTVSVTFPVVGGGITIDLPAHDYVDLGDGRVSVVWPRDIVMGVTVDTPDETAAFSGEFRIASGGSETIVTGTPDDMTFTTTGEASTFEVVPQLEDGLTFGLTGTAAAYTSLTTIRPGDVISMTNEISQGAVSVSYIAGGEEGQDGVSFSIQNETEYGSMDGRTIIQLPDGMDILDLGKAFRAGLLISGTSSYEGSTSRTVQDMQGTLSVQNQTTGPSDADFSISAEGLYLGARVADVVYDMDDPSLLPTPVTFEANALDMIYQLPILADPDPSDVRLRLAAEQLAVADEVWDLFDTERVLAREPVDFTFDVAGTVTLGFDLMDMDYYTSLPAFETPDIRADSIAIRDITLNALGAQLTAAGDMTLDNDDLETFPGFPRPEGRMTVLTQNAQALLDQLEAAGLVGPSELSGARMGLAMFSRVTDEGGTETVVEVNDQGHVVVNGQRMY